MDIRRTASGSNDSVTIFVKPCLKKQHSLDEKASSSLVNSTRQLTLESSDNNSVFQDDSIDKKPSYYRILEFLFCGPFETANDSRFLTSYRISYILDLMGKKDLYRVLSITTNKGPKPINILSVKTEPDITVQAMLNKFRIINQFIADARSNGANVILCNKDGENVCQAVALQYIMFYHKIPLKNALNYVENIEERSTINLSPKVQQAMEAWETELSEKWNKDTRAFGKRSATVNCEDERYKGSRHSRSSYSSVSSCFSQSKECSNR